MSGRQAKALRRADGLSKPARRGMEEFEATVRRARAELNQELPIVRHDTRRRVLASIALAGIAVLLGVFAVGAR